MDPVKIAGVAEWPTSDSKKEVQSFLGFTNFYHRFIEGFSHLWCCSLSHRLFCAVAVHAPIWILDFLTLTLTRYNLGKGFGNLKFASK